MCPLVPAGKESVLRSPFSISRFCREIVIDGNTTTNTNIYGSGQNVVVREQKEVVDGNTTIYLDSLVSGISSKTVVEGNTETFTFLENNDYMTKTVTVVDGNTTTRVGSTYEKGKLISGPTQSTDKLIVSGNTTTIERNGFIYHEKTVDGNTTTIIQIYRGLGYRAVKTVIDKKGSNIYIRLDTDESLRASGQEYLEQGDYDRAIADFTLLLRTQPPDNHAAWLYFNRGLAYVRKNDYDRAISDCTQAIKLDPNNSWAYNNRGSAFLGKGDRARARADWIKALQLDPSNAVARDNLERFR
jgi:hypothetical protein